MKTGEQFNVRIFFQALFDRAEACHFSVADTEPQPPKDCKDE